MTPAERAADVYQREACARSFAEDLDAHLQNPLGIVVSSPSVFVMMRPVCRSWAAPDIVDPWKIALTCAPDCWHVYLAAGDIQAIFSFPHSPLPWVSFERGNRLRFHRYETIRSRCLKIHPSMAPILTLT